MEGTKQILNSGKSFERAVVILKKLKHVISVVGQVAEHFITI